MCVQLLKTLCIFISQDKRDLDICFEKKRDTQHHNQAMIPESPQNQHSMSLNQRMMVPSAQQSHTHQHQMLYSSSSQVQNQSLLSANQFYDDNNFLRPSPMTLPPWEDFVKIEPNTQDMFGDFGCNVPISSGGSTLPSILDDMGQSSHQPFTVPCMVHPPTIGLGGMQDPNNPNLPLHNQYRYATFKMNYPHSPFQRNYHHPSHLQQMQESGMTPKSRYVLSRIIFLCIIDL